MKVMPLQEYNKVRLVNARRITTETIKDIKKEPRVISKNKRIIQTLMFDKEDNLILRELSKEKTKDFKSSMEIDVYLKDGDLLIETDLGWKKNLMSVKIMSTNEIKTIEKFNKINES
ncbi:MAG: hypothetical protein KAX49_07290 [Halanaerobiales bacterium]|nr:hypothetical protein [Halanaerobiales bacterium]